MQFARVEGCNAGSSLKCICIFTASNVLLGRNLASAADSPICLTGVLACMLPHEVVPPPQRLELNDRLSVAGSVTWAKASSNPHEIFQPQASRAGNAFFNIQQALNSDRVSAHLLDANMEQQQRIIRNSAQNLPIVHARQKQLQTSFAGSPLYGGPLAELIGDVPRASAEGNSSADDAEDDFDYFQHCGSSHHDGIHSSRIPIASNSQTPCEDTYSAVRNWVKLFSPHELVSVDAACSIFVPGSNWPGSVNLKQTEIDCQNKKQGGASQNLTSLVLRAEAEKSFALRHSHNNMTLDPLAVSHPHIQAQNKTSPTSRPSQPVIQHSKPMPPPTPPDQKPKFPSNASALKRPRGFRNDKQFASVGALRIVFHKLLLHPSYSHCPCS